MIACFDFVVAQNVGVSSKENTGSGFVFRDEIAGRQ